MELHILIKEAKQKSKAAEKYLFESFAGQMFTLCRRYVKTAEDAEELMLNGFVKFFSKLPLFKYESDGQTHAWIKRIMINECLMFLRKEHSFKMVAETEALQIGNDEDLLARLTAKEIFDLVLLLPVGYRTVFNLYAMEGMTHAEIAKELNISVGTSKSQLSKARMILQKNIDKLHQYGRQQQG